MSGPTRFSPPPTLLTVLARRSSTRPAKQTLVHDVVRSLGLSVAAALLAAPFAIAWGIGHAEIDDYLGPHRVSFASDYRGEVNIDLGPIGNAYLPSKWAPIGLKITVGGVGAVPAEPSFFSEQTLTTYAGIFAEPEEAVAGVVERLVRDVAARALKAELVLLTLFAGWTLRRQLLGPRPVRPVSLRRAGVAYAASLGLLFSSIMGPPATDHRTRLPVTVDLGSSFRGLSVDSLLLSDLLDRGIKGITLLTDRQRRAVDSYLTETAASMLLQYSDLPKPRAQETMLLGFGDLHCNQAMTELIRRMAVITKPAQVLSSGDDTVNGTAAERFCITREAKIAEGIPFVVAPGNHDSDVTESQMRSAKMTVLDGKTIDSSGLSIVGDDDPEHNIPFSVERTKDRPESDEQLGLRLVEAARAKSVDVILVHQPAASDVIMSAANPPARLVLWGHYHSQAGPTVIVHDDGTWTVGMQQGTAGGVRQPTFTSFSTPFSPPLISADTYFYFRDNATGLITGVQPVHFLPNAKVVIDPRIKTGDPRRLKREMRTRFGAATPTPTPGGPR